MYNPTLEEVKNLADKANLVPIYRELPADLETPVSVYLKLQDEGASFLLESITGSTIVARYSFIGVNPNQIFTVEGDEIVVSNDTGEKRIRLQGGVDPLAVIKETMATIRPVINEKLPRFCGGMVGYLGYDAVRRIERIPATASLDLDVPEAIFMMADTVVAFDHARQRLLVIANVHLNGDIPAAYQQAVERIENITARLQLPLPVAADGRSSSTSGVKQSNLSLHSNFEKPQFEAIVRQAQEYIAAGDIFQVVLSQRLSGETSANPFDIYRALRTLNPSPYMVFLRFPGRAEMPALHVIAASPEMHVRLENGIADLRPIAGTRPRGNNLVEDIAMENELRSDEKERAEHIMLVDLGRNDLGRVCDYGSIQVKKMMEVERYSHVMHLVSDIEGRLRSGLDAFDLLRATFPAGTLSGAPKVRAMEIIEELEGTRRGLYGGAILYIDYTGNMDSCITIRTVVMQDQTVHMQAGAGIVADSVPGLEYEECIHKASVLKEAVLLAENRGVK